MRHIFILDWRTNMIIELAKESANTFIEAHKTAIIKLLAIILIFAAGIYVGHTYFPERIVTPVTVDGKSKEPGAVNIQGDINQSTDTEMAYIPKHIVTHTVVDQNGDTKQITDIEKTDLDMNIAKTDFNVKVNGHEATFTKKDDEHYMFDKDKLSLKQESQVEFNVHVDPIIVDNTKHFGVGIGINDKGNPAYMVDIPVNKKHNMDGWIYKDDDRKAAGIKIRF